MLNQKSELFQYEAADHTKSGTYIGPQPDGTTVNVAAASFNSAGYPIKNAQGYIVGLSWPATGTPVGTVKLQVSLDIPYGNGAGGGGGLNPDAGLVQWFDVPSATYALTGVADSVAFEATLAMAGWVRVVWTRTSGSLSMTARIQFKGIN